MEKKQKEKYIMENKKYTRHEEIYNTGAVCLCMVKLSSQKMIMENKLGQ